MTESTAFSNITINIPPEAFNRSVGQIFFTAYSTSILFPLVLPNDLEVSDRVDSSVIGATVCTNDGKQVRGLSEPVTIRLRSYRIMDCPNSTAGTQVSVSTMW